MRANVLTASALTKHAGRFVWLSVDTENPKNAGFLEKIPVSAWPSFLVVDPATEQVALRWYGAANVSQLLKLLDDGERAARGPGVAPAAETALVRADRLNGERKWNEAAGQYR